ncbi:MAG: hypothetical protein AAGA60_11900 [Cyanobacteria bacterium P01_E01_bin.42]
MIVIKSIPLKFKPILYSFVVDTIALKIQFFKIKLAIALPKTLSTSNARSLLQ